jgi:hypothetical protein
VYCRDDVELDRRYLLMWSLLPNTTTYNVPLSSLNALGLPTKLVISATVLEISQLGVE